MGSKCSQVLLHMREIGETPPLLVDQAVFKLFICVHVHFFFFLFRFPGIVLKGKKYKPLFEYFIQVR